VKGRCHVIISGTVLVLVWKDLKKTIKTSVKAIVALLTAWPWLSSLCRLERNAIQIL